MHVNTLNDSLIETPTGGFIKVGLSLHFSNISYVKKSETFIFIAFMHLQFYCVNALMEPLIFIKQSE